MKIQLNRWTHILRGGISLIFTLTRAKTYKTMKSSMYNHDDCQAEGCSHNWRILCLKQTQPSALTEVIDTLNRTTVFLRELNGIGTYS